MPSGRLGAVDLSAATDTTVYTVPIGRLSSFNVCFCNRGSTPATIRLSISSSAAPISSEYLEFEASLPAFGVLERGGLIAESGRFIIARSSIASVNCIVLGVEE